jgi:hypothetical protein
MNETTHHESTFQGTVHGPVHSGSGDIIINNLESAIEAVRATVPAADDALQSLVQSLRGFAAYHEVIGEWKELHSLLQELLYDLSQFEGAVARLYGEGEVAAREHLRRSWRPCERRIRRLIDFAKRVSHICEEPFNEKNGKLRGPPWAVQIVLGQWRIRETLHEEEMDIKNLDELAGEISDTCFFHLYKADIDLHNEAGELCSLSRGILARIGQ